ncbi:MAG: peptidylprolyl isomerase [Bacteroidales bacterium]|nr:peptidylprolyl isomerase [Bacteroidales bacterium]MCF8387137.1 peptidylprolyl isomerase [Bacteroidales bacterium]MCF8398868.1 peptidylprolyl isomerase [Bacteroidales bacterium]
MKKIFKSFFILGLISLLFGGFSMAQDYSEDERTLLKIEDEKISVAEFMRIYQKNNVETEVIDKKSLEEYLDLFINFKLKVKQAEDLGLDTVQSFIDELNGYRKQLTKPYFIDEEVNQRLLEEAYERKTEDIRASHILIRVDKNASPADTLEAYNKITDIRQRALAGEDFGDLAVEYSDDPSARDMEEIPGQRPFRKGNRGDLGYFSVFDMVYPFETAAYNTEEGEISDVVRTKFGYHILKVEDRKEAMGNATVAHIYIKMTPESSTEDSAQALENIQKAYDELESGESFEEVVRQYSEDRGSVEKGGQLPPFGVNRMVPEFIEAVAVLEEPGDYSEPVLTQYGWHIVKLIERKKPGSFEDEKDELKERLQRDARSHKSEEAVITKVKRDYKFKEYTKNQDDLRAMLDSSYLKKQWSADTAASLNKKLFRIGKEKYTQYDFARYLEKKQKRNRETNLDVIFQTSYHEFVDEKVIDYLDQRLEEIYPEFGALMKEYRDGILLFELTDQKVWSKAVKDTSGLQEFHQKHKDDYMWGERVKASIFKVSDSSKLEEIITKAKAGVKAADIADVYRNDSVKVLTWKSGKFAKGENEYVDKIEWKEGISKQMKEGDKIVFVMIHEIVGPEPKKLDEARGLITADYQSFLEKQWIKNLREMYDVEVNEQVLSSIK